MARRRKENPNELSPLELEVMNIIWDLGECTSAQVIEAFGNTGRDLAKTTIRTVLSNVRKKGFVDVVPSVEPRIRFKPTVSRTSVASSSMKDLIGKLFAGSPRKAIAHLLEDESIDKNELAQIRQMLDEHDKKGGK